VPAQHQQQIDRAFANVGKALDAYQRRLLPAPARFDRAIDALAGGDVATARDILDDDEWAGARLFADTGRTQCLRCHNGPLLTNQGFHRVGTAGGGALPDFGRFLGIQALLVDPFNCLGVYSDAKPDECEELRFLNRGEIDHLNGAFKTPTLRGVADTAPYMHDGRHSTLEQVMEHYRTPPPRRANEHELTPLEISDGELAELVAFLSTLSGAVAADSHWLEPPREPARSPSFR
jgi:cytochrome c peroxidase